MFVAKDRKGEGAQAWLKPKFFTVEMTADPLLHSVLGLFLSKGSVSLFGSIELFV